MKMLSILICFIGTLLFQLFSLELEPTTSWTAENTPKEESHLYGILYGGYNTLQSGFEYQFPSLWRNEG